MHSNWLKKNTSNTFKTIKNQTHFTYWKAMGILTCKEILNMIQYYYNIM